MDDIIEKIQGMKLTRTDAEIAEYISEHLTTIGLQTSLTLAEEIGVSDTSVIRFIRKLGFKSYTDFRSAMNARIAEQYGQGQQDSLMPSEKFARTRERLKHDSLIADVSDYTLRNLEKSFSKLDSGTVDQVAGGFYRPAVGSSLRAFTVPQAARIIWQASCPFFCPG